jgi:hypothetical protein
MIRWPHLLNGLRGLDADLRAGSACAPPAAGIRLPPHDSPVTIHDSRLTIHLSRPARGPRLPFQASRFTCHLSRLTIHPSPVTTHDSAPQGGGNFPVVVALFLILLSAFPTCGGRASEPPPAKTAGSQKQDAPLSGKSAGEPGNLEMEKMASAGPLRDASSGTQRIIARIARDGTLDALVEAPVREVLPDIPFPPSSIKDFVDAEGRAWPHFSPGPAVGTREFGLVPAKTTTTGQVNTILRAYNLRIEGSDPTLGMLFLRFPERLTLKAYADILMRLSGNPLIDSVVPQVVLYGASLPPPTTSDLLDPPWEWSETPSRGNWNFEAVRFPQVWNLLPWVYRRYSHPWIPVAVVDVAFTQDSDVSVQFDPVDSDNRLTPGWHGTAVAGIIGARWADTSDPRWTGVDGGIPQEGPNAPTSPLPPYIPLRIYFTNIHTPFADIEVCVSYQGWVGPYRECILWLHLLDILYGSNGFITRHPEAKIYNFSIAYDRSFARLAADGQNPQREIAVLVGRDYARRFANGPKLLFFASAGNADEGYPPLRPDAVQPPQPDRDARWATPFCYASIVGDPEANPPVPPQENIICVEATRNAPNYPLWGGSNSAGHSPQHRALSAPGERVLILPQQPNLRYADGTSFAAPISAAAALFLHTYNDRLTLGQIRDAILNYSLPTNPELDRAPMLDAFYALTALDLMLGNQQVQRDLADVDDGTVDGNLRARVFRTDRDPNGIYAQYMTEGGGFAASDRRRGDSRITARDFRAFRDAFLQVSSANDWLPADLVSLDGPPLHFKRDLNEDRCIRLNAGATGTPANPRPPHTDPNATPPCTETPAPPHENVYPRYDFNGSGKIERYTDRTVLPRGASPQDFVAPFKRHASTECTGLNTPQGCLRDIDVMAQVWDALPAVPPDCSALPESTEPQKVAKQHCIENLSASIADEGTDPFTEDSRWRWQPRRYLLADRDNDHRIDYLYSADLHLSGQALPPPPDAFTVEITVTSIRPGGEPFEQSLRLPATDWANQRLILTVPLFGDAPNGRKIRVSFSWGACYEFTNVRYGQDLALPPRQGIDPGTETPCPAWAK